MTAAILYKKFSLTLHQWVNELEAYTATDFEKKPDARSWSVGQVYEHITSSTLNFHIKQIEHCLQHYSNRWKTKNFIGYVTILTGRIPHVNIPIPEEENIEPVQPKSKAIVKERLQVLSKKFENLAHLIDTQRKSGKTSHPGFGYLSAKEWFVLINMHFEYHRRDKQAADKFLRL